MSRWLAGIFDPSGRAAPDRLAGALAPEPATVADVGPLHVAYTGPPAATDGPLCLLDGFLDNAAELGAELAIPR